MVANFEESSRWQRFEYGVGPTISAVGGQATVVIPATSHGDGTGGPTWDPIDFGAEYDSVFLLRGDFTVDLDYALDQWPVGNGVRVGLAIRAFFGNARVSQVFLGSQPGDEAYVFASGTIRGVIQTADLAGRLRLVRTGSTLSGYFWNHETGQWQLVGSGNVSTEDVPIHIGAWSHDNFFNGEEVKVSFSNVQITAAEFVNDVQNTPPTILCPEPTSVICSSTAGAETTVQVTVADPDPDTLTVVLSSGGEVLGTATINGPTSGTLVEFDILLPPGIHSLTAEVSDGLETAGCDTTVVASYAWSGLLPPIRTDGSAVFKAGSTVPVKFRLTGLSAGIANLAAKLDAVQIGEIASKSKNEKNGGPPPKAKPNDQFRYDPADRQYICNWSTKGLAPGIYQLHIDLGDGLTRMVTIGLR